MRPSWNDGRWDIGSSYFVGSGQIGFAMATDVIALTAQSIGSNSMKALNG